MKNKSIKWIVIAIISLVLGLFLLRLAGESFIQEVIQEVVIEDVDVEGIEVGQKAPHWDLADLVGRRMSLSDFRGTPLVLTFWSTWNSAAVDQINILNTYLSQDRTPLFNIVTINNQEDRSTVSHFMRRG